MPYSQYDAYQNLLCQYNQERRTGGSKEGEGKGEYPYLIHLEMGTESMRSAGELTVSLYRKQPSRRSSFPNSHLSLNLVGLCWHS